MAYQRLIELSAEKQIKRVKAYNVVELADLLRNQWRDTHTQEAQALFAANVLFIDDIEKARNSEFMLEQLYGIIEHFVSRQRVIVITSNKSPDALLPWLGEVFGETIYRRISEFFQIVRTS